jgi:hypothetical protein
MKDGNYLIMRLNNKAIIQNESCEYHQALAWSNRPLTATEALECRTLLRMANEILPESAGEATVIGWEGHAWIFYDFIRHGSIHRYGFDTCLPVKGTRENG